MSDHRLRLTVLSILLSCCFLYALPLRGQVSPEAFSSASDDAPPVAPTSVSTVPRAAESAEKYNELQNQVFGLVRKHRDAKSDERKRIRDQIAKLTTEQFDLRHQMRKVEIERIKKHLREVEAKVDKRENLRKEIIERRITELLAEDAELRWEPLRSGGVRPQTSTTTRMADEVLPDGTSYPIVLPPSQLPRSQAVTRYPVQPRRTAPAASSQPQSLVGGLMVAEAKTRLGIAERKLERIRELAKQNAISQSELDEAQNAWQLAQFSFERTSMEYAGRQKLLQVDVRRAELELEKMKADMEEAQSINRRIPGTIPPTQIRQAAAAVEEKKLALETATTLLELHLLGVDRTENVEGVVTLDGMPVADATVTFVPVNEGRGTSATGITDANGVFRLTPTVTGDVAAEPDAGTLPGDYYVGVVKTTFPEMAEEGTEEETNAEKAKTPDADDGLTSIVPQKYSNPRESGLKFTVKKGRNNVSIELTSE